MKYVIIDNGHGYDTPGKCSPIKENGKRYYEWQWTRKAANKMYDKLAKHKGVTPIILVPEERDISLKERCSRANKFIRIFGASNCVFISVHSNAAGNGDWMSAQGWSIWTTRGQNNSDKLATMIYDEAKKLLEVDESYNAKTKVRKDIKDGDPDHESNFYVIKNTNCPAVLVENLFHDNKTDVEYLESKHGLDVLTDIMVNGCLKYLNVD